MGWWVVPGLFQAGLMGDIVQSAATLVAIKRVVVVGEADHLKINFAVAIIVADCYSPRCCLLASFTAQREPSRHYRSRQQPHRIPNARSPHLPYRSHL